VGWGGGDRKKRVRRAGEGDRKGFHPSPHHPRPYVKWVVVAYKGGASAPTPLYTTPAPTMMMGGCELFRYTLLAA
jgi:hypothetical protein